IRLAGDSGVAQDAAHQVQRGRCQAVLEGFQQRCFLARGRQAAGRSGGRRADLPELAKPISHGVLLKQKGDYDGQETRVTKKKKTEPGVERAGGSVRASPRAT